MIKGAVKALALLVALMVALPCVAWNKASHKVSAEIAYAVLARSQPGAIQRIAAIMHAHPAAAVFEKRMRDEGEDGAAHDERLFMEMAQWPDEVRAEGPFHRYHHETWHFVDIPYVPRPGELAKMPAEGPAENIFWAFQENLRIVLDASRSDEEKAVALCWVFNLVGDLHQPLHVIALFDRIFPEGDKGGSLIYVRREADAATTVSLHSFWEDIVTQADDSASVRATARRLANTYLEGGGEALRRSTAPPGERFEIWGRNEIYRLAVTAAYNDLPVDKAKDRSLPLPLPFGYENHARTVAEEQLTLAGYRLAEIIAAIIGYTE